MVMALCNTVVPIKRQVYGNLLEEKAIMNVVSMCDLFVPYTFRNFSNDGTISYKAQSQDEEALVNAASNLNMVLTNKDSSSVG
jgi:hypothetical protein